MKHLLQVWLSTFNSATPRLFVVKPDVVFLVDREQQFSLIWSQKSEDTKRWSAITVPFVSHQNLLKTKVFFKSNPNQRSFCIQYEPFSLITSPWNLEQIFHEIKHLFYVKRLHWHGLAKFANFSCQQVLKSGQRSVVLTIFLWRRTISQKQIIFRSKNKQHQTSSNINIKRPKTLEMKNFL